jgi:hypothetical protein
MNVDRDASPVVGHGHRAVTVKNHADVVAMPGKGFIDGVVDDFEDHVVESGTVVRVADVHARPLTDRVESAKDFDAC